jgi:hypothetical protein
MKTSTELALAPKHPVGARCQKNTPVALARKPQALYLTPKVYLLASERLLLSFGHWDFQWNCLAEYGRGNDCFKVDRFIASQCVALA